MGDLVIDRILWNGDTFVTKTGNEQGAKPSEMLGEHGFGVGQGLVESDEFVDTKMADLEFEVFLVNSFW